MADIPFSDVQGDVKNIRQGVIDDPILRVLRKNEIVDIIKGALSWNRASSATYVDRYGVVRTASSDEPRQEKSGWLIERPSENISLWSEDFSMERTLYNSATIDTNVVLAPDGQLTGSRLNTPVFNGKVRQNISVTPSTDIYTFSVWVKADGNAGDTIKIDIRNDDISAVTTKVVSLTDEWVRHSVTMVNTLTSGVLRNDIVTDNPLSSLKCFIWGAQCEQLSTASSYIPTEDIALSRAADVVGLPFDNNMPSLNEDWTISFNVNALTLTSSSGGRRLFGQENSELFIQLGDGGEIVFGSVTNGFITTAPLADKTFTLTIVNSNGSQSIHIDGSGFDSSSIAFIQDVSIGLSIGHLTGGFQADSHITDLRVWDTALNTSEISTLGQK